jgi:hypothetical protein
VAKDLPPELLPEDAPEQPESSPEQKVGYGKPPREHQFAPGKSGNPRGRPRGAKGLKAELTEEMNEWVTITSDGKQRRVRKRRIIIKALAAKAAKGNVAAADRLISLIIQAEGLEDQRRAVKSLSTTDLLILDQFLDGAEVAASSDEPLGDDVAEGPADA